MIRNARSNLVVWSSLFAGALSLFAQSAAAQDFESLGDALKNLLGPKVFPKTMGSTQVYYSKKADGTPDKVAFVEKGLYKPNCTHTWVIALDEATSKVTGIEVLEMQCPHAFPTKDKSYLDQYTGKGPAEAGSLMKQIDTIAKATGSCNLMTDAVVRSIGNAQKAKSLF